MGQLLFLAAVTFRNYGFRKSITVKEARKSEHVQSEPLYRFLVTPTSCSWSYIEGLKAVLSP